jgi:hypothetical protein
MKELPAIVAKTKVGKNVKFKNLEKPKRINKKCFVRKIRKHLMILR